jgi:hypothetical protein
MANPFLDKLNNTELMSAFGVTQDNAPLTPEQLATLSQQVPEPEIKQPVVKVAPAASKQEQGVQSKNSDMQNAMNALENWQNRPKEASQSLDQSTAPDKPLSKLDQLEAMMNELQTKSSKDLEEARKSDRMLKVGGALGDALATYLNAQSQMNVKAPGVQVQQGAGLGKVADMFATAPEIQSDVAQRREAMMKQYGELAKGERAEKRLTSEEKRADKADKRARELTQMQIEGNLKAAGIKAAGKSATGFTPYQEKQIKREDEKDLQKLSTSITKLGLPTITSAINSIENQIGMTLEEALQRNTDDDKTNDVEVPGYGRVGSLAPDVFVGDKSRAFRQDVGSLLNPQISKQFGASQTKGEIERFQKEVGSGTFESEAAILRGLSNIKRSANADLKATYAGYRPELVDTYRTREGVTLQESPELDPRVELFMKQNKITDRDEAIKILKDNKIIK